MWYLTNVTVFSLKFKNILLHPPPTPSEFATAPGATWHTVWEYSLNVLGHLAINPIPVPVWCPYEK